MQRKIIAGNWKMNGSHAQIATLLAYLMEGVGVIPDVEWIVFPSFVYLPQVATALNDHAAISWGAQNVSEYDVGAYTGEVSAAMLQEFNCRYVLVGHSERRQLFSETNEQVARKFMQAHAFQLQPILCVGETLEQRRQGATEKIIAQQIDALLGMSDNCAMLEQAVIAYEPVWAIGTGEAATPQQAQEVHAFIRQHIAQYDEKIANHLPILYGGSVKPNNAKELFAMDDIDGGLIGGASLDAQSFLEIGKCINSY